jgi:hypothetical protein
MEKNQVTYIKVDNNVIINKQCITWVKKMNDCLYICAKTDGCYQDGRDTFRICKQNNLDSYNKLEQLFK